MRAVDLSGVASKVIGMVVLLMVQESVEMRLRHPIMRGVVERVNESGGPYFGIVMAYPTEERALQDSGLFVPSSLVPWVDLAGRRFHIGQIKGVDVIYVMTGEQILNAGVTVQILIDKFDLLGIIHYGTAGSANDSLSLGDVCVLQYVAFTGSWKWKEFKSDSGELKFGAFNYPNKGENLLASIEFTPTQVYSPGNSMNEMFWLPVDSNWFTKASQLQNLNLQDCINSTYCLPYTPKVVYGLKGSTADVYLSNAAYRQFLYQEFNISTIDEESAAVVMTSTSNEVPCIVFRGISDWAGREGKLLETSFSSLASVNALSASVEFLEIISTGYTMSDN